MESAELGTGRGQRPCGERGREGAASPWGVEPGRGQVSAAGFQTRLFPLISLAGAAALCKPAQAPRIN